MKQINYIFTLLCVIILSSCSSDIDEFQINESCVENGILTVGIGMPTSNNTRVSIEELQSMKWEANDQIIAEGYTENYYYSEPIGTSVLKIQSGANSNKAVFKGDAVQGALYYKYIYIGKNVTYKYTGKGVDDFTVDYMNGQVQNGQSTSHLKDFLCLRSNQFHDISVPKAEITLNPQNAILKLNLKTISAAIQNAQQFEITNVIEGSEGERNVAKLTYNGALTAGNNNFLYLAFNPNNTVNQNEYFRIDIKANGMVASAKALTKEQYGKYLSPGTIVTATIDFSAAGSWQLIEAQKQPTYIYTPDFLANDSWIEETTQTAEQGRMWTFSNGVLEFNGANQTPKDQYVEVESRIIKSEISLVENNEISFTFNPGGFENIDLAKERIKFAIRLNGETSWEELPIPTFPTWLGWDAKVEGLVLPAKYNNKKVDISFYVLSKPYKYAWSQYFNAGAIVKINNLKIFYR